MSYKKYHINAEELIAILYHNKPNHLGFSEDSVKDTELSLNIKIPDVYKSFLIHSGNAEINDFLHHILYPEEISFSYEIIEENLKDLKKGWAKYGISEKDKQNDYYVLSQLPKEAWHTLTKNYLVIWYENQAVFHAGILYDDLKLPDPPVYITVDDDFLQWCCCSNSTTSFLLSMIIEAILNGGDSIIECSSFITYQTKEDIYNCLQHYDINLTELLPKEYLPYFCKNIRTCWDEQYKRLFICLLKQEIPNTLILLEF